MTRTSTPSHRRFNASFCLSACLLLLAFTISGCDRGAHPSKIGKAAPDFTVTDSTRTVHLRDYRGQVVLLNFWATWCPPCVEELPTLEALHHKMPQLTILAVSVDDDPNAYHQFLINHQIDITTVRDAAQKANMLYGTIQFPETYVIDRKGILRRKFIGAQDWTNPEILDYLSKM